MSHTPGPWIAELLLFNRTDEMRFLLSTPDDELGHIQLRNTNIYDALANARVIAAAPDLLEACEDLLLVVREYVPNNTDAWVRTSAQIERAKAAIAKAEGREG